MGKDDFPQSVVYGCRYSSLLFGYLQLGFKGKVTGLVRSTKSNDKALYRGGTVTTCFLKEDRKMAEKMLVTQALDERDLLVKKIGDKIDKASFTDVKKHNETRVMEARMDEDGFCRDAESSYQQIMDLIERFQKIDSAIVASNAITMIHTSFGDYTVAGAISLRSRMRCSGSYEDDADFEQNLYIKMKNELDKRLITIDSKNKQLETTAENMRLSILGKDSKAKDDKPLAVVTTYVLENTSELVDPLDVKKKVEEIKERRSKLLSELDTQIKVSNATTFIEI